MTNDFKCPEGWEIAQGWSIVHDGQGDPLNKYTHDYVVLRRKKPKPMPELRPFDVVFTDSTIGHRYVVTSNYYSGFNGIPDENICGTIATCSLSCVRQIFRNGILIWERGV